MKKLTVLSYFYPQTTACTERRRRAAELGYELVNESQFIKGATPLFPGHDQPRTYCLGDLESTVWDDADPAALSQQIRLAKRFGIEGFIFDTYGGYRGGKIARESREPLETFLKLGGVRKDFQFALLWIMSGPRVVLPVPRDTLSVREPGQVYDYSLETARLIVDDSAKYWKDPTYVRVDDRPYLAIMPGTLERYSVDRKAVDFLTEIKKYAIQKYNVEPYVVGIERRENYYLPLFKKAQLDAVSAYAFLPDFEEGAPPIQSYALRRDEVMMAWERMRQKKVNFIPPVVVGWDASPRGEPGATWEDVTCKYPFTPILMEATVANYEIMAREAMKFAIKNTHSDDVIVPICAFNEVGESCALLPRVRGDKVDFQFLEATQRAINQAKKVLNSI